MNQERRNPGTSARATSTTPLAITEDTIRGVDALADLHRRREAAVRMDGGENPDPLFPGRQFHPLSTGLRAAGYRQGYAAALRYVVREFGEHLTEVARAKLTAIANRSEE